MAKIANKTVESDTDVAWFLAAIEPDSRRTDAQTLCAMMARVSGEPPRMWGKAIIGFGRYHYRYDSGREGDMARISFSPRKTELVLYIMNGFATYDSLLARLGKHRTGKSCLYIKALQDVDGAVLEAIMVASLDAMAQKYPA